MLPYKRSQRVGDLLRQEISEIVLSRIKDPRLGFITVTDVELSDDLKTAHVFISVLKKGELSKTLKILNAAAGFIRHEAAKNVKLRQIPNIVFAEDISLAYGMKIDGLLKNIEKDERERVKNETS
ncbi:30S ribosome-binding factor RbfA [Candidatus Magnetominusculus dajiuhuensis]|uniref:30S ribosome-binding factor RbfA n=1 Tax=Candidatus Magnetominusculus dajiuhuensis TaxID=3137712 RepID=UPI0019DDC56F|nr:30S ribosome-binding factor RbfA [Nitrospirota bacterium]MBF0568798.1 30S ribosome-binding factor RbfA [Nitrospirota bacterium]